MHDRRNLRRQLHGKRSLMKSHSRDNTGREYTVYQLVVLLKNGKLGVAEAHHPFLPGMKTTFGTATAHQYLWKIYLP